MCIRDRARLAQATDPLGLQRRLAAAMLGTDAPGLGLYFVDDHFVSLSALLGWNMRPHRFGGSCAVVGGGGDGEQVEDLLLERVEFGFEGLDVLAVAA